MKFRTCKTGLFKMPCFENSGFKMEIIVASLVHSFCMSFLKSLYFFTSKIDYENWTSVFYYHCTMVTFLLYLGQKVSLWVLVDILCPSLFNVIKYVTTRYYKYKISGSHLKIPQKLWKKYYLCSSSLNQGPWGCETCMLPKSYGDLLQKCILHGN